MVYVRVLSRNKVGLARRDGQTLSQKINLRNTDGDVLLNHGDMLSLTPAISVLFSTSFPEIECFSGLTSIQRAEVQYFHDSYHISNRAIGSGGQSKVFCATECSTQHQVACKVVPTNHHQREIEDGQHINAFVSKPDLISIRRHDAECQQRQRAKLRREVDILARLDHPNIISLHRAFFCTDNLYIFQELITGGDLLSYLDRQGPLGEAHSASIVQQLLGAVEYLHCNGVVHRDIKPENVLMTSWKDGCRIILSDFGQARLIGSSSAPQSSKVCRMQSLIGTTGYVAPEIFRRPEDNVQPSGYTQAVDLWSVGCVTAVLLTCKSLFAEGDDYLNHVDGPEYYEALYNMVHADGWQHISTKAKDFIARCIALDESERITASQALRHIWLCHEGYADLMQAAYEHAIKDWKPRVKRSDFIEYIDTSDAVRRTAQADLVKHIADEVKSRHFNEFASPVASPMVPHRADANANTHAMQSLRINDDFPQIGDEEDPGHVEPCDLAPSVTQLQNVSSSQSQPSRLPHGHHDKRGKSTVDCSIAALAPPSTQVFTKAQGIRPFGTAAWPYEGTDESQIAEARYYDAASADRRRCGLSL